MHSPFHRNSSDVPPLRFETGLQGQDADRLSRFIWNRIIWLITSGQEAEANALVEEFDEPALWDDPLD
ncbi:MAG: hypothetical protein CMN95_01035 [Synechococcus sp. MED650]|nr:hypothetical protein [Synechococcus sp. MED650]OUW57409.1 MAG: hypothetical protein CBD48_00920 [Cyanobacteria bacterium TMED188]